MQSQKLLVVFFLILTVASSAVTASAGSRFGQDGGWFWQNPLPQGNPLHDVYVFDANTAIAVGDCGTVMKTKDGGVSWDAQHNAGGTSSYLRSVDFVDALTGWAVGDSGTVLKTANGGTDWISQTSGTSNFLYSVKFVDANTGWTVGSGGLILKTTNAGADWNTQTSGTTNSLYSVDFVDVSTGWAVGDSGTILKTTNGGTDWDSLTSGTSNRLSSVHFVTADTGWAVGEGGTILKTTTGGNSFVEENFFEGTPKSFFLSQNYPNPFNPSTTIRFSLVRSCHVTLKVYNILGQVVETLVEGERRAGEYELRWSPEGLASGIYFYRLQAGKLAETKKLILLK